MANCKLRIAHCGSIFGGQPGPHPQGEKSRSVYVVVLKQGMEIQMDLVGFTLW